MKLSSALTSVLLTGLAPLASGAALLNNANTAYDNFMAAYGPDYDHSHCMGASGSDVCILWKVDKEQEQIQLALLAGSSGWAGFGLTVGGGMPGADMLIFEAKNPDIVADYTAVAYVKPILDNCPSDWKVQGTPVAEDGFLAVRVTRALDTNDPQDVPFVEDADIFGTPATTVIAAWGDEESGLAFHGNNVARSKVRFFATPDTSVSVQATGVDLKETDAKALLEDISDGSITVFYPDYPVPPIETYYHTPCFNASDYFTADQLEQGVYLIGADYLHSTEAGGNDNTVHLHHMVGNVAPATCADRKLLDNLYFWAPGTEPLAYPTNAGIKVGGGDGAMSFGLNVHYDNPNGVTGLTDSTGIRWYYVSEPREHAIGQLLVGDAVVALNGKPVGSGQTRHTFNCPGTCTTFLFDGPVTVFSEGLHEHELGVRVVNEVIRNGDVVNRAVVDYFDFPQNGVTPMRQQPYTLYPGDSFKTTCYYDTPDNSTTFGFGTREEMCQSSILYYPANRGTSSAAYCFPSGGGPCSAAYEGIVESDGNFDRPFGLPADKCPFQDTAPPTEPGNSSASVCVTYSWVLSLATALLYISPLAFAIM